MMDITIFFYERFTTYTRDTPLRIREGQKDDDTPSEICERERTKGIVVRKNRTRYTQPHGRTIFLPFAIFFFLF